MEQTQKHAVLISCFHYYPNRLYMADRFLKSKGYTTFYLTSDFDHAKKRPYKVDQPDSRQIHVRAYRKNLSAGRVLSHRDFARGVYKYLESLPQEPAVVMSIIPPNFLGRYLKKYKRRHPNVKLIFDLYDMWPESFPSGEMKKLLAPVFNIWGGLRNRALPAADCVFTECDLYRERLGLLDWPHVHTQHLAGCRPEGLDLTAKLPQDRLNLCYLGSINNIIDIPAIASLLNEISALRPVTIHVVGRGERQEELLEALGQTGAQVCFHGPVFDPEEKRNIMSTCHLGLNIMKTTVCVGLTMKSVDYFSYDLPIINNIPADTSRLVAENGAGFNLDGNTSRRVAQLTGEQLLAMRENVHRMYDKYFEPEILQQQLNRVLEEIV